MNISESLLRGIIRKVLLEGDVIDFSKFRKKKEEVPDNDERSDLGTVSSIGKKERTFGDLAREIESLGDGDIEAGIRKRVMANRAARIYNHIVNATHGKFSPSTLRSNMELVSSYSDEELGKMLRGSRPEDWVRKPSFYRALAMVARNRGV